jgi:hypothetical protein
MADLSDRDLVHIMWLLYRKAVQDHIERAETSLGETEAQYRERAEKAGLVAVANFIAKAYQQEAA